MSEQLPREFNPFFSQCDKREPSPYNISIVGWENDENSVVVSQRGTIYARMGEVYCRFGIAEETGPLTWENHSGYLPCLVTSFQRENVSVKIMHFCNKVTLNGNDYSLLYSRVAKTNNSAEPVIMPAEPSYDLLRLSDNPGAVGPGQTQDEDFVVAVDRFGKDIPWPNDEALRSAGSWKENFAAMREHWNSRLAEVVQFEKLPDPQLADAWRAGHCYQLIMMSGYRMDVGVNAYREEFSHDTIGMVATLIASGDLELGRKILDKNRCRLVAPMDYPDGDYKYPWPWALYMLKSGDTEFVRSNFTVIRAIMKASVAQMTGEGGIMRLSCALDCPATWLVDNWAMLTGLAAYKIICSRLSEADEEKWAQEKYDALLDACNKVITEVNEKEGIDYLSAFMLHGYGERKDKNNRSAGWATSLHMGRWPWEGYMLGARQEGIMLDNIDNTYDYGFDMSSNVLPPHSFGAFDGWCTAYNAGFAFAALRGDRYRSEGIRAYQWMIENGMCGPYSWWESAQEPAESDWQPGQHPKSGWGSCPHMWGDSFSRKILLNSLIDEFADGRVIIGRGIPEEWLAPGEEIKISNVPLQEHRRFGYHLTCDESAIRITFSGDQPVSDILLDLPGAVPSKVTADGSEIAAPNAWPVVVPGGAREVVLVRI